MTPPSGRASALPDTPIPVADGGLSLSAGAPGSGSPSTVAPRRRSGAREKLLAATMDVCARSESLSRVVVDDILQAAGVARATFYSHFKSAEDAINSVASELAAEMVLQVDALTDGVEDPVRHVAIANHLLLARAAMEPRWGAYLARWDYFGQPAKIGVSLVNILEAGRKAGDFSFASVRAAVDFTGAGVLGATRRLVLGRGEQAAYMQEIQEMLLVGLGVPRDRAHAAVLYAAAYLRRRRAEFPWWRDLRTKGR